MNIIVSCLRFLKTHTVRLQSVLPQAIATGLITLSLIVLISAAYRTWGNDPPIYLVGLDPKDLGTLDPGQEVPIHNHVTVSDKIAVVYYISVKRPDGSNIIGTQEVIAGILYQSPIDFEEKVPWKVPDLPPGKYLRAFAIRNLEGHQNTVSVESAFTIK